MKTKRGLLFFVFAIIISASVFAFFFVNTTISPDSRLKAEQEIYSVLLADKRIAGEEVSPILELTTLGEFQDSTSQPSIEFIIDGLPILQKATLVDFQENNKDTYPIKNFLPPTNDDPLVSPSDNQQIWWVAFSRIGLNPSVTQALVLVELHAACKQGVCEFGNGNLVLLQKIMGKWIIFKRLETWHTHPT